MRLDIYHHADQRVVDKLDMIISTQELIMDSLDRIEAAAARETTLEASVAAMVTDLKSQLADALSGTKLPPDVEARLAAIFPTLEANNDKLTSILTANTPAAPPADPKPTPDPAPIATDPTIPSGTVTPDPTLGSTKPSSAL